MAVEQTSPSDAPGPVATVDEEPGKAGTESSMPGAAPSQESTTEERPKEMTKSALKKAERLRAEKERKAAKEKELTIRRDRDEASRRLALEEAKKVVIVEDKSLPKARRIQVRDRDPDTIRLRKASPDSDDPATERAKGTRVKVTGWVHRLRQQKDVMFVTLQDGTFSTLQCVFSGQLIKTYDALTLTVQTSMTVYGEMWEVPGKQHAPDDRELHADYFEIIGRAPGDLEAYGTVVPPDADVQTLLNRRHLVIRGETASAVLKVMDLVLYAFHQTYYDWRFRQLRVPCMVQTQVEGGSTLFDFKFFDEKAFLTQSSQLYLETGLPAVGNNYCIMPSFRAEKSQTRRHLAEYTHIEAELGFIDFEDLLEHLESLIVTVIEFVLAHAEGKALMAQLHPGFRAPARPFLRMRYADAITWLNVHEIDKEDGTPHEFGDDIAEAAERKMTDIIAQPIFLTYFPTELKAFYMKRQATDPRVTESVDCLMPGVGEIVGGSMRMDDLGELLAGYARQAIDPAPYYWYTDQRKYGSVPHGGYGLGLERFIAWICNRYSVKECTLYPRFVGRCTP
ncbi:MAG: hypothetical protein M1826_006747 [Phylliscum demangeonii]|nr:MAG: hypothetical protein M1826_006747 [Phylliscum demangeonii]